MIWSGFSYKAFARQEVPQIPRCNPQMWKVLVPEGTERYGYKLEL
jgi:hypothetical protein